MNKLKMKAKAGVTLVELLVVILIVVILSVSLLPLLKPYIEQAKYAAEVQPTLANIQTKINLYQYEKDRLPGTKIGTDGKEILDDLTVHTWWQDNTAGAGQKVFKKAQMASLSSLPTSAYNGVDHLTDCIDVDWQDLMGKRMNPSHFYYKVIKGVGAACYGYVLAVFGDGNGLAKGTGYAILVLVDTDNKLKVVATWERYKPVKDEVLQFKTFGVGATTSKEDSFCYIPEYSALTSASTPGTTKDYQAMLTSLKEAGWSFNFDDAIGVTAGPGTGGSTTP